MKKLLTLIAIVISQITCVAEYSLNWEQDISSYLSGSRLLQIQQRVNGNICLRFGPGESGGMQNWTILIYDSEGSVKLNETIAAYEVGLVNLSSNPDLFAITISSDWESQSLRLYHFQNDTYNVTNFLGIAEEVGFGTYNGARDISSGNSSFFYIIQDSKLKQYQLDSPPVILGNTIAAGVDGSNYILQWNSVAEKEYQIQSSTNLINWVDIGVPINGTGASLTWANTLTNSKSFFRVTEK